MNFDVGKPATRTWYDPVDFITELELSNITGGDSSKRNEYDIYNYLVTGRWGIKISKADPTLYTEIARSNSLFKGSNETRIIPLVWPGTTWMNLTTLSTTSSSSPISQIYYFINPEAETTPTTGMILPYRDFTTTPTSAVKRTVTFYRLGDPLPPQPEPEPEPIPEPEPEPEQPQPEPEPFQKTEPEPEQPQPET